MTHHLFVYGTLSPRHAPPEIAATVRRYGRWGRRRCGGACTIWGSIQELC